MAGDATFVEREFAGAVRRFQLQPPDRFRLYKGVEADVGNLSDLAMRAAMKKTLSTSAIAHILSHALSGGHPIRLNRMRALVTAEMRDKPLGDFAPLAVDIIAAAYAGAVNDSNDQAEE